MVTVNLTHFLVHLVGQITYAHLAAYGVEALSDPTQEW